MAALGLSSTPTLHPHSVAPLPHLHPASSQPRPGTHLLCAASPHPARVDLRVLLSAVLWYHARRYQQKQLQWDVIFATQDATTPPDFLFDDERFQPGPLPASETVPAV